MERKRLSKVILQIILKFHGFLIQENEIHFHIWLLFVKCGMKIFLGDISVF